MSLGNTTEDWVLIEKHIPIARMEAANLVPPVTADFIMSKPQTQKMSDKERQKALMEKLDLSGLDGWDEDLAIKARNLLMEYHDLFSLEKSEISQTKTVEHTIVVKDPDATPFKTLSPTELNEVVRTGSKIQVPPFRHKIVHGKMGLILQGYKMNVMTHGLEKRLPQLPLGIEVLYSYTTLTTGSDWVAVSL